MPCTPPWPLPAAAAAALRRTPKKSDKKEKIKWRNIQNRSFHTYAARVQWRPVVDVVIGLALVEEETAKEVAQVAIVGRLVKGERPHVVHVRGKLHRQAGAQLRNRRGELLLGNSGVLGHLRPALHVLPGQPAVEEVDEEVAERLQVVPAALFYFSREDEKG